MEAKTMRRNLEKSRLIMALFCLLLIGMTVIGSAIQNPVFSGPTESTVSPVPSTESETGGSGDYSLDSLETAATTAISSVTGKIVAVCMAICPLAIIICLAGLLFTHDERKISGLIKIAAMVAVATLAIILVNNGVAISLIKSIADMVAK